jgi:serine protease Do
MKRAFAGGRSPLTLGLAAVLASLVVAGCSEDGGGQEGGGETTQEDREAASNAASPAVEVVNEVGPSVVQINTEAVQTTPYGPQEAQGLGSGVIYREDGYIVTNNHVVEGAEEVNVAFADGSVETGEVVGTDPYTDLAVVKVDRTGLPAADFAEARDDIVLGQLAVAIGSPSGFQSTVTSGVISGLGREVPARLTGGRQETALVDLIQTDAAISPGSSGGALANGSCEVVGINVAYLPPGQTGAVGIGFAIPADTATEVADGLIEEGEVSRPYLGVSLTDLTPQVAERFGVESGALVTGVDPNGPAAGTGIEPSAVITAIDGEEVETTGDLLSALRGRSPGETVELTVEGDGEAREVSVELGERPQEPPDPGERD